MRRSIAVLALGAVAALGSGVAAQAATAVATGAVNVRTGPGTQYGILSQLQPGQPVDVRQCSGGWCYVVASGPDGWVSANYLSGGGGYVIRREPSVTFNFGFGFPRRPHIHYDDDDYGPTPPPDYPDEEPMPWPPGGEEPMPWPPEEEYAPPPSSQN